MEAVDHLSMTEERMAERAELSLALIHLFRGVVYRADQPRVWQAIVRHQAAVGDHAALFALRLYLNEGEGYAFLRQEEGDEEEGAGLELPRLVSRRPLSYPVSLLLALLRKKLAEHDASSGDPRLILTRSDIAETVRLFLPETGDEVRFLDRLDSYIENVVKLGFLRRLRGQQDHYEVMRILAAFVDAQWLGEFEQRLQEYRAHALGEDDADIEAAGDGAGEDDWDGSDTDDGEPGGEGLGADGTDDAM